MPTWAAASAAYFLYIAAVAAVLRGLTPLARVRACAGAAVGLLLTLVGAYTAAFWLRLVVLPPMTLLVAYWCSGLLWVAPMERIERFFIRSDRVLRVPHAAARLPRAVAELLELAYAGIYPLIPIALVLHLSYASQPDADRFWTVILITDFICFGMLPWVQTRPPRALDASPPWRSNFRSVNVTLLGETSIGVNTLPSGHAAEALAVTLLLVDAPVPVAAAMALAAMGISAGAVLGRYHFALDVVSGWLIAIVVWMTI